MSDRFPFVDQLRSELLEHAPAQPERHRWFDFQWARPVAAAAVAFTAVVLVGAITWFVGDTNPSAPISDTSTTVSLAQPVPTSVLDDEAVTTTSVAAAVEADWVYRDWRFVEGSVDDRVLRPTIEWPSPVLNLAPEVATFPADCNRASAEVVIAGTSMSVEPLGTTTAGCVVYTDEAALFAAGFERLDTVQREGEHLVLTGPGVSLRFAPSEQPEMLATLAFTAPGAVVELPFADGRSRGVTYALHPAFDQPHYAPTHLLTAEVEGAVAAATVRPWAGEEELPDTVVTGPGPDRVVMPDDIGLGEYRLCSPYWEADWFCLSIEVRPPAADWFVTADDGGITLHDANATSRVLWDGPAALAFLVGDVLVFQDASGGDYPPVPTGPVKVLDQGNVRSIGEADGQPVVLHDAGVVDGRIVAVATGSEDGRTELIDVATGDRTGVGAGAEVVRLQDGLVLALQAGVLEARSTGGEVVWSRQVGEAMLVPADDGVVRLHVMRFTDGIQYFDETRIALADGAPISEVEHEMELPDDDLDHVDADCVRSEFDGGDVFCPLADRRNLLLQTSGDGWGATYLEGISGIPTLVRSGP